MNERDTQFFQPLWRRVLVTVIVAAWTAFEWYNGDQFWALLSSAITAYAVWAFFLDFDKRSAKKG